MSDDTETPIDDIKPEEAQPAEDITTPLEVTIKKEKKPYSIYESQDDPEMDNVDITSEQIKEYEDGKTSRY